MAIEKREAPIAAVGAYDSVLPFQAIGVETVAINADNRDSLPQIIAKFAKDQYAAVFLEESLFADFREDVDGINETESLSVIPIPNQAGSLGVGVDSIRASAERAVGMDIFNVG
ncbi:MAG: V-type ATP synthase subunit F [Synergistaceae bacterium]|jgi:V/A-type H+-transporting ATPase subunit F|nr:V-type ATP synthase subunit F [Synergistaceae bacterium]